MPKPWRLTRQAEGSLIEIARWTNETFSPRQAAAYEEDLIARFKEIAEGAALSQDCRRIIDPDLPEDLRFARCGQHFIIFVEDAEQVVSSISCTPARTCRGGWQPLRNRSPTEIAEAGLIPDNQDHHVHELAKPSLPHCLRGSRHRLPPYYAARCYPSASRR